MENLCSDSEHGQKVPDTQEMVQILQRQKKTNSNGDDSNSDKQDKSSNSDLLSLKVTSTPLLSPAYEVEINESFEWVYIPPNITPENASPVPMQLVEKSVEKKGNTNASFSSTSSEAVSIPSIPETDNDTESVQSKVNLS